MEIQDITNFIDENKAQYIQIADRIWEYAELAFREHQSSKALSKTLEEVGFKVTRGVSDMDTAFVAETGRGKPVIAFLGEYDALPGLSQEANVTTYSPIVKGGPGHGCGHHILGTSAMAAAIALKNYIENNNLSGTIRYYGCPAEEGGAGKIYMARDGLFNDTECAITWHPADDNNIWSMNFMAIQNMRIHFTGIASHSASQGHLGRNALSAVELTNIASNYLRGHVQRDVCINYAVTDAGGTAPNVIQANAEVVYCVRAATYKRAKETAERIKEIAQGAAMMTGTKVEVEFTGGLSELVPNRTLERIAYDKFLKIGPVSYTQDDVEFCKKIHAAFPENAEESTFDTLRYLYGPIAEEIIPKIKGKYINDIIYPYTEIPHPKYGSTDVCDVSWFTPTVQFTTACYAKDTPGHSWQEVAQGKRSLCHNGMLTAAKIMALTGAELFTNPEAVAKMRAEFEKAMEGRNYLCPIAPYQKPPKY